LYLDQRWDPGWPHEIIDWPDFGLPVDTAAGDRAILAAFTRARSGERVEVGCYGGLGRTGTVLGCMAVLAGVEPDDAIAWVRSHYQAQAVETDPQQRFVLGFGQRHRGRAP
jgi:protein-tyrosine phosphatase